MRLIVLGLAIAFLAGCSSLNFNQKAPKEFKISRLWARDTLGSEYLGYRRMHRMEPLLTETMVIQANAIDGMKAYDRKSGHLLWDLKISNGVEGGAQLVDGRIYFASSDGQFYCVDASNGQSLWTFPIRAEGLGEPLVKEGRVFFLAGNNIFYALDAETGKSVWTYSRPGVSQLSIRGGSRPNMDENHLYVGFSDGYIVALNKVNGGLVWEALINRSKRFKDVDAYPVIFRDRIFIPSYDGGLYSIEKATGKILWSREEGGYSAVSLDQNRIYFGSSAGQVMAVDIDSGKELWKFAVKGLPTQPKLYRGLLLVGDSAGPLYALDARNGKLQAQFHPGRGVTSAVAVDPDKGEAYFISVDANLFALKLDWAETWQKWPWEPKERL